MLNQTEMAKTSHNFSFRRKTGRLHNLKPSTNQDPPMSCRTPTLPEQANRNPLQLAFLLISGESPPTRRSPSKGMEVQVVLK